MGPRGDETRVTVMLMKKYKFAAKIEEGPGDTVEAVVWRDQEERTLEVPADFEEQLKKEGLAPVFEKLSYTHRKEYCRWIIEAKKQETRSRRLEKAVEMLRQGVKTPD